ncbi:hypothetical protein [Paenibacillus tianjinensis]|uniref:Uncharacterized protein n=1 Tax=Paenibacillus tianjinensis TaxID=2810347 RepID=A0ABX7LAP5_9BACL|nr:hypothetical protein [Paenibacillus tianjinensis]QSF43828.1 hypothetical protein JRJ22_21630 [Paenibacillus tianjinensis]
MKVIAEFELEQAKDIETSINRLREIKRYFFQKSTYELKLIKAEVNSIVDDYKQVSIFSSMITSMLAIFTIIISIMREIPTKLFPDDKLLNKSMGSATVIYAGLVLLALLFLIKGFVLRAKKINFLNQVLELVITEREMLDKEHSEAYIEFLKYLKERDV